MPKRVFDVTLALVVAPIAALLAGAMAVPLALELRGNPFFRQQRVGRDGQPFTMYKLRTLHYPEPPEDETYPVHDWSTYTFPAPDGEGRRQTHWGTLARKTSIDELPNLINVVRGEMSLVGPRPEIPALVAQYPPRYHRRHEVRPGIAGLAQVSGRSDLTYDEIVSYDLRYVDGHSVAGDIRILWRSLLVVLRGTGAR